MAEQRPAYQIIETLWEIEQLGLAEWGCDCHDALELYEYDESGFYAAHQIFMTWLELLENLLPHLSQLTCAQPGPDLSRTIALHPALANMARFFDPSSHGGSGSVLSR